MSDIFELRTKRGFEKFLLTFWFSYTCFRPDLVMQSVECSYSKFEVWPLLVHCSCSLIQCVWTRLLTLNLCNLAGLLWIQNLKKLKLRITQSCLTKLNLCIHSSFSVCHSLKCLKATEFKLFRVTFKWLVFLWIRTVLSFRVRDSIIVIIVFLQHHKTFVRGVQSSSAYDMSDFDSGDHNSHPVSYWLSTLLSFNHDNNIFLSLTIMFFL